MILKQIMQTNLVSVSPATKVTEVAKKMRDKNVGCVLITENGMGLRGIISDRDIVCFLADGKDPSKTAIEKLMKSAVITATMSTDVFEAGKIMASKNIRRLPVMDGDMVVGLVSTADLASFLEEELDNFMKLESAYQH
ncbi:MAG: CBS domain-containing protein [Deltaproteobacteria bacterium]|nr:CBS domain-containing protein [Deltaproteobacteria bacterium]